jgi:hypothetical protein
MNGTLDAVADELRGTTPAQLDLANGDHLEQVHAAADRLLDQRGGKGFLDELEQHLFRAGPEPLMADFINEISKVAVSDLGINPQVDSIPTW